jgi:TatD DNase family protein
MIASMEICDAHNHLHDARLLPHRAQILAELSRLNVTRAVVNGTRENDWDAVAALAAAESFVLPSFGLHPWRVAQRTPDWLNALRRQLAAHPEAGIGEIGLDRWVKGHDLELQKEMFLAQMEIAAAENRPATIHCLQAWGALWDLIEHRPVPACGFLLHAYGGPSEMVKGFVERGARFSFNPYFLHERKADQREVFRQIPLDRLLIETDAPDMLPPDDLNRFVLSDETGAPINHPANIALAYDSLAQIRAMPVGELAEQVGENFSRLFGNTRVKSPPKT